MDKRKIINDLVDYYCSGKDGEFAKKLGVAQQTLSNWKSRNTLDYEIIYTKCENINAEWLLSNGEKGDMILPKTSPNAKRLEDVNNDEVTLSSIMAYLKKSNDEQKIYNANFSKALELLLRQQAVVSDKQQRIEAEAAKGIAQLRDYLEK